MFRLLAIALFCLSFSGVAAAHEDWGMAAATATITSITGTTTGLTARRIFRRDGVTNACRRVTMLCRRRAITGTTVTRLTPTTITGAVGSHETDYAYLGVVGRFALAFGMRGLRTLRPSPGRLLCTSRRLRLRCRSAPRRRLASSPPPPPLMAVVCWRRTVSNNLTT